MNSSRQFQNDAPWFLVCGEVDKALSDKLSEKVAALRNAGTFSEKDEAHIKQLSFSVTREGFRTSPERMELLRRLCQIYSVDVRPQTPTSHRRVVGSFIVLAKKILQPVVHAALGPALINQREFNAATISLLIDLCNEAGETPRSN